MPRYCISYQQRGRCEYENRCKFLHEQQPEEEKRQERISKLLSNVLRHKADEFGIEIREDGYCQIRDILNHQAFKSLQVTEADLEQIVAENTKKRFASTMENNIPLIRANQGHTMSKIKDEMLLRIIPEDKGRNLDCYHGTYKSCINGIRENGLQCMGRNHMHFACPDLAVGSTLSGMREDCEVKLILDMNKCYNAKIQFFQSENGVVLTKGVPGKNCIPWDFLKRQDLAKYQPNACQPNLSDSGSWRANLSPSIHATIIDTATCSPQVACHGTSSRPANTPEYSVSAYPQQHNLPGVACWSTYVDEGTESGKAGTKVGAKYGKGDHSSGSPSYEQDFPPLLGAKKSPMSAHTRNRRC